VVNDIEVEIIYSTSISEGCRADVDNIIKPTLDALVGVGFTDDRQVGSVTATLFDKNKGAIVDARVEYIGQLFFTEEKHVVLICVYSDSRLKELGGEGAVRNKRRDEFLSKHEADEKNGEEKHQRPTKNSHLLATHPALSRTCRGDLIMGDDCSRTVSVRPTLESIFLYIAWEAVQDAEAQETDWRRTQFVAAGLKMQDQTMITIAILVQALEAFINIQAKERLSGALWDSVERLEIRKKWMVVTRLLTGTEWERSKQPYQIFEQLVTLRNALVHYKPTYGETAKIMARSDFEDQFTGTLARRYFDAVYNMIAEFFSKVGERVSPEVQPGTMTRGIFRIEEVVS
jgi:Endodeoxyribonuclease RusA